jgi:hypothetical protein
VQFGFCTGYNSSDVLIVGLAFRISIPFRNPHAGLEETGTLENGRKSGAQKLVHAETSAGSLSRQARSRRSAIETSKK